MFHKNNVKLGILHTFYTIVFDGYFIPYLPYVNGLKYPLYSI